MKDEFRRARWKFNVCRCANCRNEPIYHGQARQKLKREVPELVDDALFGAEVFRQQAACPACYGPSGNTEECSLREAHVEDELRAKYIIGEALA